MGHDGERYKKSYKICRGGKKSSEKGKNGAFLEEKNCFV